MKNLCRTSFLQEICKYDFLMQTNFDLQVMWQHFKLQNDDELKRVLRKSLCKIQFAITKKGRLYLPFSIQNLFITKHFQFNTF